jgi:hypothetical protein
MITIDNLNRTDCINHVENTLRESRKLIVEFTTEIRGRKECAPLEKLTELIEILESLKKIYADPKKNSDLNIVRQQVIEKYKQLEIFFRHVMEIGCSDKLKRLKEQINVIDKIVAK